MTGHRTYNGEWLIMDGRSFDDVTFLDCILVYHGGALRLTNSTIIGCDLIGPWPLPASALKSLRLDTPAAPEPEVALARKRWRLPRWKPSLWFWAYAALCIPFAWVIAMAMTT